MEGFVDRILERTFGQFDLSFLLFNIGAGLVIFVAGLVVLFFYRAKGRFGIGLTCLVVGSLAMMSGVLQLVF